MMKKRFVIVILLIILCFGCNQNVEQPVTWTHYVDFQNADIIFDTITSDDGNGQNILAYYSFQDNSITELNPKGTSRSLIHPYYLDENTIIAENRLMNMGLIYEGRGNLFIFSKVQYLSCSKLIGTGYPHNGNIVFFGNEGLSLINSKDCSIIKTIISRDELHALGEKPHIGLKCLSSNEDFLILDFDLNLIKLNLPEKKIFDYERVGTRCSISPDQKKVVYLARDGFHLMGIDGEEDRLIVPYTAGHNSHGDSLYADISTPSWSSDSKRIAYHKCTISALAYCHEIDNFSIFMYDLETETETFLFQGGRNPSWGWEK